MGQSACAKHSRRAASQIIALGLLLAASPNSFGATGVDPDDSSSPADLSQDLAARSDAGMDLRRTFEMIAQGQIQDAEPRLTRSLNEYQQRGALPEEIAVLLKYRADVRVNLGQLRDAREDYTAALSALHAVEMHGTTSDTICLGSADVRVAKFSGREETGTANYCVYIPSSEDVLLRRARISMLLGGDFVKLASQDLSRVIAEAEAEGALQPYAHLYRGDSLMLRGQYQSAADDYQVAAGEFASIGDKVSSEVIFARLPLASVVRCVAGFVVVCRLHAHARMHACKRAQHTHTTAQLQILRTRAHTDRSTPATLTRAPALAQPDKVARAGWAFALYGAGKEEEAVSKMQDMVLRTPSINGEIELLLSLAEKEATVHVALAAHYWAQGQPGAAEGEWDRACVRLDAMSEFMDERSRRGQGASPFDKQGAAKVAQTYFKPPGVNKRGCKQFRDRSWVSGQRAWPPSNLSLPFSLSLSGSLSFARARSLSLSLSLIRSELQRHMGHKWSVQAECVVLWWAPVRACASIVRCSGHHIARHVRVSVQSRC